MPHRPQPTASHARALREREPAVAGLDRPATRPLLDDHRPLGADTDRDELDVSDSSTESTCASAARRKLLVGASLPASATKAPPKTRASKPLHAPGDQPVTDGLGEEDPVHVEAAAR